VLPMGAVGGRKVTTIEAICATPAGRKKGMARSRRRAKRLLQVRPVMSAAARMIRIRKLPIDPALITHRMPIAALVPGRAS
jgi:hypothetical protein